MYSILHVNIITHIIVLIKKCNCKTYEYGLMIKLSSIVILEFIATFIFKFIDTDSTWIAILLGLIFVCAYVGLLVTMNSAHNYIDSIDKKIKSDKRYIDQLKLEIKLLMENANENERNMLSKLYDKIIDSDPSSIEEVSLIEEELFNKIMLLRKQGISKELIDEINFLLIKRNETLKIYK